MRPRYDYNLAPLMLYWEVTRSCDLACRHCRAEAFNHRHPQELTTEEGKRLLEQLSAFGPSKPHLVFTGGDPLKRPDLVRLVEAAVNLGFVTSVTPSGTPLLTDEAITHLQRAGVKSLAFSLDGSTPALHDGIRGVPGSFDLTLDAIRFALASGVPVQINTLVSAETAADLVNVYRLVTAIGVQRWALFFLIGTGRGAALQEVSADEGEALLETIHGWSCRPGPIIKTTEAPQFRRIDAQQQQRNQSRTRDLPGPQSIRAGWGIRDGAGIMFISHRGDIYPSGFLPISAGNIRDNDPVQIYRESDLFRALRDPKNLKRKCGFCEYRVICGGSRARAYAATGDYLAPDPLCPYQPAVPA